MRKNRQNLQVATIQRMEQSYHAGGYGSNINYAFLGFRENLYFRSDRTIPLDENFRWIKDGVEQALKGFGLEMEESCNSMNCAEQLIQVLDKIVFADLPRNLFKFQHDGSLVGRSAIEAITQVMTKEFIRNSYPGFKKAYEYFKLFEIAPNDSCGMHCNMSVGLFGTNKKTREEALRKFIYFVNKNYRLMCDLVKRSFNRTGYCCQMNRWTSKDYAKSFNFETLREYDSDHSLCFNIAHYPTGRVELRLVGGQRSYPAFRNTMEVIFHLVDKMKDITWVGIDDVKQVFKGCNKYVLQRLQDCVENQTLTSADYEIIKANADNEYSLGNY